MDYASGWFVRPLWELTDRNQGWQDLDLPMLVEHKGDTNRSQSIVAMVPEYGLGVVLLSNTGLGTHTEQQRWTLDAVLHELLGTTPEEPSTSPLVAAAPVLMIAIPLLQLASVVWLARAPPAPPAHGPGRRYRGGGPHGGGAVTLGLWVVPS